jgi:hypothetical protein
MGLKCSTDYAQEVMNNIFHNVADAGVYIMLLVPVPIPGMINCSYCTILTKLKDNGFTVNPLKCEWAVKETDLLGYWLTPCGLKPCTQK